MTDEARNRMADEIAATLSDEMVADIDLFLATPSAVLNHITTRPRRRIEDAFAELTAELETE
jgi:hypothetical protein